MDLNTASWMALFCFLSAIGFLIFSVDPNAITFDEVKNKDKTRHLIRRANFLKWYCFIAAAIQLIMVFQGIHLLSIGYEIDFSNVDGESLGRAAARGRGRGGIILLIIQFLPYFLIAGYGYLSYTLAKIFVNVKKNILKYLHEIYSFLSEANQHEMAFYKDSIKKILDKNEMIPFSAAIGCIGYLENQKSTQSQSDKTPTNQREAEENSIEKNQTVIQQELDLDESEIELKLEKIQKLKDKGLINNDEYAEMRRKALDI